MIFILRGIPGSGKSTFAKKMQALGEAIGISVAVCSADDYFMVDGEYKFDRSKLADAHQRCYTDFEVSCIEGVSWIIVDNTATTLKESNKYIEYAEYWKEEYVVIEFACDVDTAVSRNQHGVPREAIERMASRFVSVYNCHSFPLGNGNEALQLLMNK